MSLLVDVVALAVNSISRLCTLAVAHTWHAVSPHSWPFLGLTCIQWRGALRMPAMPVFLVLAVDPGSMFATGGCVVLPRLFLAFY